MKIDLNDFLRMARRGVIVAFNRSDLAKTEHFHEWLERQIRSDHSSIGEMLELVTEADRDGLPDEEQAALDLAQMLIWFAWSCTMEPDRFEICHTWQLCLSDLSPHLPRPQDGDFIWCREYPEKYAPRPIEDAA